MFINRLKIPLSFCVEGTAVEDLKAQLFLGITGKHDEEEDKDENLDLQQILDRISNNDPKSHFKKLAAIKKFTQKQKSSENRIEKITILDKNGADMKKFRKAHELYFLMKNIKK